MERRHAGGGHAPPSEAPEQHGPGHSAEECRSAQLHPASRGGLIGRSQAVARILDEVARVAPTHASVLLQGESGTGKEMVAHEIHSRSPRAAGPLLKVNCIVVAESQIESELFGHERGAFTGALHQRPGRFELARGGTLYLEEVGDLGVSTQLKVLRALQQHEIERVGGQTPVPVDVRVVAGTHRDLERLMAEQRFREELYYRLKVVTLHLPPLRDRREDIPLLLEHFLRFFCEEHGRTIGGFSARALQKLCGYPWPGNVRELRNCVEGLVVVTRGDEIDLDDLPSSVSHDAGLSSISLPLGQALAEVERRYILGTLEAMGGNKARAAGVLGIGKKTLYRRLHEYGVVLSPEEIAESHRDPTHGP